MNVRGMIAPFVFLLLVFGQAHGETLRVGIIPINDVAPLFVAKAKGYFAEENLEIETASTAGGAVGIPALVSESFDIVYGNVVSALLARSQGIDIKVIAPGTQIGLESTDTTPIVARADDDFKTGKDLEGKIVAVNTRNNVIWLYTRAWIRATGGDPDRVTFREVPFPQMVDALRQKRIDAAMFPAPFSVLARQQGFKWVAKPYSVLQLGVNIGQYLTTGNILKTKQASMTRFVAALRRGAEWFNANQTNPELLAIIADYSKTDTSILKSLSALQAAPLHADMAQIDRTMQLMISEKLLSKPVNLADVISREAL